MNFRLGTRALDREKLDKLCADAETESPIESPFVSPFGTQYIRLRAQKKVHHSRQMTIAMSEVVQYKGEIVRLSL